MGATVGAGGAWRQLGRLADDLPTSALDEIVGEFVPQLGDMRRLGGLSDEGLIAILKSGTDPVALGRIWEKSTTIERAPIPRLLGDWRDGERFLREPAGYLSTGSRQCLDEDCVRGSIRILDAYKPTPPRFMDESKVGRIPRFRSGRREEVLSQIRLDSQLEEQLDATARWHFFPNRNGRIETDPAIFATLEEVGIEYFIYLP